MVSLGFNKLLMADGYSLENFRKYLDMAVVSFPVSPEFDSFTADPYKLADVEFVSYVGGVLHVRFKAAAAGAHNSIPTPTYNCGGSHTCEYASCYYASEDGGGTGASVMAQVDITAPIQQIEP